MVGYKDYDNFYNKFDTKDGKNDTYQIAKKKAKKFR